MSFRILSESIVADAVAALMVSTKKSSLSPSLSSSIVIGWRIQKECAMDNDNEFYDAVPLPLGLSKILGMKPALFELVRFGFSMKMMWRWLGGWPIQSQPYSASVSVQHGSLTAACFPWRPSLFRLLGCRPPHSISFPERCLLPFLSSTVHA